MERYLGENLIFIISQPRSGSTLLQRVLAGHPDIQTSAETWLMLHPVYGAREQGIDTEYGTRWALLARTDFLEHYTDGPETWDDAIRAYAQVLYKAALEKSGGRIFIDKTPRYIFIIKDLYRLFPKAHFIFLLRNPLAILSSELTSHVQGDWQMLSEFRTDLLLAPHKILEGIAHLGKDAIVFRYEDFVQNPESEVSRLCERLGIEFRHEMLDYSDTPDIKGFMRDRVGLQQHSRPVADNMEKWRSMLGDPQELHFALSYLRELGPTVINDLGYPYDELSDELRAASARAPKVSVFPWYIAIMPREEWTLRDLLIGDFFRSREKNGPVRGTLVGIFKFLRILYREVRHTSRKSQR